MFAKAHPPAACFVSRPSSGVATWHCHSMLVSGSHFVYRNGSILTQLSYLLRADAACNTLETTMLLGVCRHLLSHLVFLPTSRSPGLHTSWVRKTTYCKLGTSAVGTAGVRIPGWRCTTLPHSVPPIITKWFYNLLTWI